MLPAPSHPEGRAGNFHGGSFVISTILLLGCAGATGSPAPGYHVGSGGSAMASGGAAAMTGGRPGEQGTGGGAGGGGVTPVGTGGRASHTGGASGGGGATTVGGGGASGGAAGSGGVVGSGGGGGAVGGSAGGAAGSSTTALLPFKGVANSACADLGRLGVTWWYNWSTSPGTCATPEFVPMIAGKNEKTASAVTAALTQVANAGYKVVLGFNEPNKANQSNLTVAQALALWPALSANSAIRVGSPATSADGQAWFTDFMTQAAASSLRIDFIALHWYGWDAGSCDAKAVLLENYLKWAEGLPGNRPLWLTEWGCMNLSNPDAATVQAFYSGAMAMFARHPRLERYAWYPWNTNNELVTSAGALTPLGTALANAPAHR